MKKFLIGLSQIALFAIIYEIASLIVGIICGIIVSILLKVPVLGKIYWWVGVTDFIKYTIMPVAIGYIIITIFTLIYKENIISFAGIIITLYTLVLNILSIISCAKTNGIISWDFVNQVWYAILFIAFCSSYFLGAFFNKKDKE